MPVEVGEAVVVVATGVVAGWEGLVGGVEVVVLVDGEEQAANSRPNRTIAARRK